MSAPEPKRPYAVLRALLSIWLISWVVITGLFISAQLAPQPLFGWGLASIWIGVSVLGWLVIFRLLRKLRKLPAE